MSSVSRIVKGWLKANRIEGHGSLLSLRKTWALHAAKNTASPASRNKGSSAPDYFRSVRVPTRQEVVYKIIEPLWYRVSPYYYILFRQTAKPNPVIGIRYHQEIINAVKNKDADGVAKWIETDLTDSTRFVLSIFDAME